MRSLLWSVVYAVILIGLLQMSVGQLKCPNMKEMTSVLNCTNDKWFQIIFNAMHDEATLNQAASCLGIDQTCNPAQYAIDNCEIKSGYKEEVSKNFTALEDQFTQNGIQWSAYACDKLNPKIDDNCKQLSKWLDCRDYKEVEAKLEAKVSNPNPPDSPTPTDTVTDSNGGEVTTEEQIIDNPNDNQQPTVSIPTTTKANGQNDKVTETQKPEGKPQKDKKLDNEKDNKWIIWVIVGVVVVIIVIAIVIVFYFMAQSKTNKEQAAEAQPPSAVTAPQEQTGVSLTEPETVEKVPSAEEKSVRSGIDD